MSNKQKSQYYKVRFLCIYVYVTSSNELYEIRTTGKPKKCETSLKLVMMELVHSTMYSYVM